MRDVTMLSMKSKSVHICQFVHHANFHCIMTTLNKLFKNEFERGDWKRADLRVVTAKCVMLRCKVCRANLFKIVYLFTTPNFIEL